MCLDIVCYIVCDCFDRLGKMGCFFFWVRGLNFWEVYGNLDVVENMVDNGCVDRGICYIYLKN